METTVITKPKRKYTRKAKPVEVPVEVPVEITPIEVPVEIKSEVVKPEEIKQDEVKQDETKPDEKTKKRKRNVNPDTMTYLKAFKIWKEKTGYRGLSPKKDTDQYKQIMVILNEHKKK